VDIIIQSRVLSALGDSVSTDDIFTQKHLPASARDEDLGTVCMRDLDPDFPQKMAPGGFLVAGKDFGCGSSRERAPMALKAAGVKVVIAEEFARIFYRNALNICLPVVECPDASEKFALGDELRVDLSTGTIQNVTRDETVQGVPIPAFLLEMMQAGGLVAFLKQQLAREMKK
jgi:3-isopropylmalate/(R)-2-methylmalate dehydratase small subunit